MPLIDIGTVLNKFNDTVDERTQEVNYYGIRFLNSRGEIRELVCRKNVKAPKRGIETYDDQGKGMYHLKRNGVMLIQAINEAHPRSIKPCMIFNFRDSNSRTWLRVFHDSNAY